MEKIDTLNNKFLKNNLENIRTKGNDSTHTKYLKEITSKDLNETLDSLLNILSFMLINYFETYEFGSRVMFYGHFHCYPQ